jgi:hypothetical protein
VLCIHSPQVVHVIARMVAYVLGIMSAPARKAGAAETVESQVGVDLVPLPAPPLAAKLYGPPLSTLHLFGGHEMGWRQPELVQL